MAIVAILIAVPPIVSTPGALSIAVGVSARIVPAAGAI
jgi:hypothetical protein